MADMHAGGGTRMIELADELGDQVSIQWWPLAISSSSLRQFSRTSALSSNPTYAGYAFTCNHQSVYILHRSPSRFQTEDTEKSNLCPIF